MIFYKIRGKKIRKNTQKRRRKTENQSKPRKNNDPNNPEMIGKHIGEFVQSEQTLKFSKIKILRIKENYIYDILLYFHYYLQAHF